MYVSRSEEPDMATMGHRHWVAVSIGAGVGLLLPELLAAPRLLRTDGSDGGAYAALAVLTFGLPLGALGGAALGWGIAKSRKPGRSRASNALLLGTIGLVIGFVLSRGVGDSNDQLRLAALCTALAALAGILPRPR